MSNVHIDTASPLSVAVRKTPEAGKYFVYEEGTLGYVRPDMPDVFAPLAGERDHRSGGFHVLESERAALRPATEADFARFRVLLPPDFERKGTKSIETEKFRLAPNVHVEIRKEDIRAAIRLVADCLHQTPGNASGYLKRYAVDAILQAGTDYTMGQPVVDSVWQENMRSSMALRNDVSIHVSDETNLEEVTLLPSKVYPPEEGGFNRRNFDEYPVEDHLPHRATPRMVDAVRAHFAPEAMEAIRNAAKVSGRGEVVRFAGPMPTADGEVNHKPSAASAAQSE
jgi:hypothetical protein